MSAGMAPAYQPDGFSRHLGNRRANAADYRRTDVRPVPSASGNPRRWRSLIGPVLLPGQVAELMDWTADQVEAAQKDHALLGCRTRDGVWVFPTYQFRDVGRGELVQGFADVMRIFGPTEVDRWAVASWFVTPLRTLGGRPPIEFLRESEATDEVRQAALEQARAWQQ